MTQPKQRIFQNAPTPQTKTLFLNPISSLPFCRARLSERADPKVPRQSARRPLFTRGCSPPLSAAEAGRSRPRQRLTHPSAPQGRRAPSHLLHRPPLPQRLPPPHSPGTRGTRTCRSCYTGSPRRGTTRPAPPAAPAPPAPRRRAQPPRAASGPPAPSRRGASGAPVLPRALRAHRRGGAGSSTAREAGRAGDTTSRPAAAGGRPPSWEGPGWAGCRSPGLGRVRPPCRGGREPLRGGQEPTNGFPPRGEACPP